jgi:hypothetical protein
VNLPSPMAHPCGRQLTCRDNGCSESQGCSLCLGHTISACGASQAGGRLSELKGEGGPRKGGGIPRELGDQAAMCAPPRAPGEGGWAPLSRIACTEGDLRRGFRV